MLENKVNAIKCPKIGKPLEYRHLIQDPETKAVWNPAMATEVYRLISTEKKNLKKEKYTTGRKGGIHQIGGISKTKQGIS